MNKQTRRSGLSVRTVVAIGIGTAILFLLKRWVSIPTFFPNTSIDTSYGFLGFFAVLFGPLAAFIIGFAGHALNDATQFGSPWWSWVFTTGLVGWAIGFLKNYLAIESGQFGKKKIAIYNTTQVIINVIGWGLIAPSLDMLIYSEPANKVFVQGIIASISNSISTGVIGTILLIAYAKSRTQSGSLVKEAQPKAAVVATTQTVNSVTSNTVINFENVSFKYDSQAEPTLRNINLTINQGEKVLIVGPSGSGKTTLGNLINGLIPHALTGELTGKVTVAGVDVARANLFDLSLHVGTVLQDPDSQFVSLTAAEDIAFALENDETALPTMQAKVKHWAKELDLELQLSQNPQTLSGGQKQRNAMAGVLIDEGEILLFDEPLAALDPAAGAQAMALIEQLHERLGMTVVMIEHRIEDVLAQPVDRIIVMSEGQIIADDRPEVILQTALFKEVGLRAPLYLEALQAAQVPLTAVTNLSDVEKITAPDLGKQLQIWQAQPSPATAKGATTPLLTLAHVDFKYVNGPQIFKDFNLTINQGEMLAIVGKNGVGKTTLSQLITGFVQPNAGTITLGTTDLATLSVKERADKIGYVMQDPNHMISKVLIREEVALGLVLRGLAPAEIDRRVDEVLKVCGLYAFRNWPISALSFGQKKRVTIASILVLAPKVIILDEPTAGQDWAHYTEMMQFLQHLNATTGVTLIFITHDMHLMLEYATRTVALGADGILADASPATVLADATVVAAASLAQTSLYKLAQRFQLNPVNFTEQVIKYEMRGQHE
ncbi:ECF-type riboflavin transporter substrate-binding protein [Periweissella ghanensis]|uniref:UPF0397 protein WGH24286_01899 n=1 Tax=Periweissella ghanensis TaxID=467997 RepID=A0ABN8BRA7_9LACO|nr:ECF-type riboflavin transporter substrate-binding protein [Periweissella ghanensis]CAH0419440.1 Vitamin B12 import ATP-binding protein BtuD [Periweissella ghanensis]